jgi:hypothetical protein
MCIVELLYVPFGSNTHKSALKRSQLNIVFHYGVGGTLKLEGYDMVGCILSKFSLKFRDIKWNIIWHKGIIGIMMDNIIN